DQFRGDHMIVLEVTAAPAVVDAHISPDDPAQFAEPLQERCIAGLSFGIVRHPGHKHADAPNTLRLLRPRREWPSGCAAEQRDELAALHSITSSARASNVGGISSPSALAVPRLMTSSNLVARSIGVSAGLAPLRMRPVRAPARR